MYEYAKPAAGIHTHALVPHQYAIGAAGAATHIEAHQGHVIRYDSLLWGPQRWISFARGPAVRKSEVINFVILATASAVMAKAKA
jgi:hypothetical protein